MTPKKQIAGHSHGRVPKAVREQQILDVAERLFIEKGYEAFRIEDVCLAAGVSRPVVYEHFGAKDKLYLACVRRARMGYEEELQKIQTIDASPLERLKTAAEMYFGIVERDPARWLVLFGGTSVPMFGELGEAITELRAGTIVLIGKLIRQRESEWPADQVDAFAHAIFAIGEQLGRWWIRNPDVTKERTVELYLGITASALGVKP